MEEKRAEAGGIMIGQNTSPAITTDIGTKEKQDSNQINGVTEELLKLKKLLDEGILSDVEFQEMKSKILSRNSQNF